MGLFSFLKPNNDKHKIALYSTMHIAKKYIDLESVKKIKETPREELKNKLLLKGLSDLEADATIYYILHDYDNAFHLYSELSNLEPEGLYSLGICYQKGLGTQINDSKAFKLFQEASLQGHAKAMISLSIYYQIGKGVTSNLKKSIEWEDKALELSEPLAHYARAIRHLGGAGLKEDFYQSLLSLKRANIDISFFSLGYMHKHGLGTFPAVLSSFELFKKAADVGDPRGMNELIMYYSNSKLGFKDFALALYWAKRLYQISLNESNPEAGWDSNILYKNIKKLEVLNT